MGRKLFVGGLAWATDESSLKDAFSEFGDITYAKVIMDRDSGRSKGFGFVEFETEDAANSAMTAMDGASLDGRNIRVNEANERGGGGGRGPRRHDSGPRRDSRPSTPRQPEVVSRGRDRAYDPPADRSDKNDGGHSKPRRPKKGGGRRDNRRDDW